MLQTEVANIAASYASPIGAISHAIQTLQSMLVKHRFVVPKTTSQTYLEIRRDLPYVIHLSPILGTQILVNRNYKPIGHNAATGRPWVKYEEYMNLHVSLTTYQIISVAGPEKRGYLFNDANAPWRGRKEAADYLLRLTKLLNMLESQTLH